MKVWSLIFFFVCSFILSFAQSEADQLIKDGIKFHDNQEYDKAIKRYEAALKLEPNNLYAHAEIAMTMMYARDFEGCVEHADVVIASGDKSMYTHAVVGKASCLDYLGKRAESIKLFKQAIKDYGEEHMLLFNLGVTYYSGQYYKEAEEYLIKGINTEFTHPGGHFILAKNMAMGNQRVKAMMAYYYFLLLEPTSPRTKEAFDQLEFLWSKGINEGEDGNVEINIFLPPDQKEADEFQSIDMLISMLQLTGDSKKEDGEEVFKSEAEKFKIKTQFFVNSLADLQAKGKKKKGKKKKQTSGSDSSFYRSFYGQFFNDLNESGHLSTFGYFIQHSLNEDALKWCEEHPKELEAFGEWLNGYFTEK